MIDLLVSRRGQTDYNLEHRYAGSADVPLNETGVAQALALAAHPALVRVERIVSSPLKRAMETARIVRERIEKPLYVIDQFAERRFGVYEGLTHAQIKERYPDLYAMNCTRLPDGAPTDGESLRALSRRVQKGLCRLLNEHDQSCVLLIAHGGVAMEINRYLSGLPFEGMFDFKLGNARIAEYRIERSPQGVVRIAL